MMFKPTVRLKAEPCDTHRPLARQRHPPSTAFFYQRFDHVNLRRAASHITPVGVLWPRVRLAVTRATREALPWQVREYASLRWVAVYGRRLRKAIESLVCEGADITGVVGVWPLFGGVSGVNDEREGGGVPCPPERRHIRHGLKR